jgi:hypothetical protein
MYYVGQAVYSQELEVPIMYMGRTIKHDDKEKMIGYNHECLFQSGEVLDDWEFMDLVPLVTKSGEIFKGDHNSGYLTGNLKVTDDEKQDMIEYLDEIKKLISKKTIKPLEL